MTAKIKSLSRHTNNHYKNKPRGITDRAFEKVYWPYLPVVLVAGLLLTFGAQSGTLQAAMRPSHTKVLDYATSMTVSGLLADTNSARANNDVAALSLNSKLNAAAQAKASDMASRNYWSHNTPEGDPPWVFVTAQHYSYQKLGENLAAGFSDEQATINGWMASAPHRANMLDPTYIQVGFGSASNANYTSAGGGPMTIVVAYYGKPPPAATAPASTPSSTKSLAPAAGSSSASSIPAPSSKTSKNTTSTAKNPVASTEPAKKTESKIQPTTTESPTHGLTLSYRSSRAQVAFAHLPQSSYATGFAIFAALAAAGLWISRHFLTFRRVFVHGESFVFHHPLVDVGLLTIAATSFLMTQTAGFIQ